MSKNISKKRHQHRDLSPPLRFGRDDKGEGGASGERGCWTMRRFYRLGWAADLRTPTRTPTRKTAFKGSAALPFVISTEAQRSGEISVLMPLPGNVFDRILLSAVFEDLFCQVVFYLGLIAHHFVVGGSQELGAAVAQLLADVLLHSRVVQLTLSGRFLFYQLVDCVAHRSFRARGQYWNNVCDLSWL